MKNPLVSIIVAVYGSEKWINQCVDSLLAQTYRNIEVILVDDGSPDRSGAICDEYAAADSRVKVIHQPNGGVGVARQTGIENATGEYSIHADPDDWVDSTMIEELVTMASKEDADMVICDYFYENEFVRDYCHLELESTPSAAVIERKLIHHELSGFLWNKMFRRACCEGIDFPRDVTLLEDELFDIRVLRSGNIKRIAYLPKAFYHYRTYNTSSIIHVKNERHLQSQMIVLDYLFQITGYEKNAADCFIDRKTYVLYDLFLMKRYEQLFENFPEIHQRLIDNQRRWHIYRPLQSGISLALRGYPKTAHFLYMINQRMLNLKKSMKIVLLHITDKVKSY